MVDGQSTEDTGQGSSELGMELMGLFLDDHSCAATRRMSDAQKNKKPEPAFSSPGP